MIEGRWGMISIQPIGIFYARCRSSKRLIMRVSGVSKDYTGKGRIKSDGRHYFTGVF